MKNISGKSEKPIWECSVCWSNFLVRKTKVNVVLIAIWHFYVSNLQERFSRERGVCKF